MIYLSLTFGNTCLLGTTKTWERKNCGDSSPSFPVGKMRMLNGFKRFAVKEVKSGTADAHTLIQLLKVM